MATLTLTLYHYVMFVEIKLTANATEADEVIDAYISAWLCIKYVFFFLGGGGEGAITLF